jgi:uncharacterized protein (TIGR04255 family)
MKRTLKNAPLVHAVLHLRFSEIPNLTSISPEMLKALHTRMIEEGFEEKISSHAEVIDMSFDPISQLMKHSKQTKTRTLFRAAGERDIFEISENAVVLKSTFYNTFNNFYGKFYKLLVGCTEIVGGLDKALLKSVALRYVDVIVPSEGNNLSDFVSPEILPPSLSMMDNAQHIQGITLKAIETAPGQILQVHFEELRCQERRIHKVLPDNLMEPDNKCGLVIDGQIDWLNVSSETYGILDVDHSHTFIGSPKFDIALIEKATKQLYQHSNDVFWGVISDEAKRTWNYMEVDHVE